MITRGGNLIESVGALSPEICQIRVPAEVEACPRTPHPMRGTNVIHGDVRSSRSHETAAKSMSGEADFRMGLILYTGNVNVTALVVS